MNCEFITKKVILNNALSSVDEEEFKIQFKKILDEAFPVNSIVYVFKTENEVNRLCGKSNIIYIGQTINNLYSRYISRMSSEVEYFRSRYKYIISTYGKITIELYVTSEPEKTESRFLYQYNSCHKELPPLNLQTYKEKNL